MPSGVRPLDSRKQCSRDLRGGSDRSRIEDERNLHRERKVPRPPDRGPPEAETVEHVTSTYASVTSSSPSCWLINRATSALSLSPVLDNTKSCSASDQSSLKLVASAEIQICRTGALGEITNLLPSSKEMWSAPGWPATSRSADSSASISDFFKELSAASARLRKSFSSSMGRL